MASNASPATDHPETVEIDSSDDDEETQLQLALEMSLQHSSPAQPLKRALSRSISPPPLSKKRKTSLSRPIPAPPSSYLKFPQPAIKKTWAFRHPRSPTDIKIEEVLDKSTLNVAVFSAFDWDVDWILSKLSGSSAKQIWVMGVKTPRDQDQWRQDASDIRNLRLVFPDMSGQFNCMHAKFMLLFHPTHLRIAIPSANLNKHDWGETGLMENSVFIVDLPRLEAPGTAETMTDFGKELLFFIKTMGLDNQTQEALPKFDWSATANIAFVHTIGGPHTDGTLQRTGLPGLSTAIRRLGLESDSETIQLDFVASSIGALNLSFLTNIILFAAGKTVSQVLQANTANRRPQPADQLRIYFPLDETVRKSTGGPDAAGTNCLQKKYYYNTAFPKQCMRDYESARTGLLSHNKLLYVRGQTQKQGDGLATNQTKPIAYLYHGSANISEAAWGRLNTRNAHHTLRCSNWECGVVMPVPADALRPWEKLEPGDEVRDKAVEETADYSAGVKGTRVPSKEVFDGVFAPPMRVPGRRYEERKPWFFKEEI